jgi:hypothetical protein
VSKAPSPLLGFNNNIKHKGRVFHVQTEDSGIRHPHIITHLFMDGGRILKTVKTSYAEHLANEKMGEIVRKMMKDQHKAMFMALRDGAFDAQINFITPGLGVTPGEPAPSSTPSAALDSAPLSAAPSSLAEVPPAPRPSLPSLDFSRPSNPPADSEILVARAPLPVEPPPPAPAPPASTRAPALHEPVAARAPSAPIALPRAPSVLIAPGVEARPVDLPVEGSWGEEPLVRPSRPSSPPLTPGSRTPTEPPARPAPPPPARSITPGNMQRPLSPLSPYSTSDLPPPPATVLGKNRPQSGAYSEVSALAKPSTGQEKTPSGRYLASRPTSQAATSRPPDGRSLFGDDLISEKSLDEVILSYLAEDLDTTPPKK